MVGGTTQLLKTNIFWISRRNWLDDMGVKLPTDSGRGAKTSYSANREGGPLENSWKVEFNPGDGQLSSWKQIFLNLEWKLAERDMWAELQTAMTGVQKLPIPYLEETPKPSVPDWGMQVNHSDPHSPHLKKKKAWVQLKEHTWKLCHTAKSVGSPTRSPYTLPSQLDHHADHHYP